MANYAGQLWALRYRIQPGDCDDHVHRRFRATDYRGPAPSR